MKSNVISKIVLLTEDGDLCSCDEEFSKTCVVRLSGNLPCRETIVRLTPVDRSLDNDTSLLTTDDRSIESKLRRVNREFIKTLNHLDRMT